MPKGLFKRTLKWKPGDLFALPLTDGSFGVAQAIAPVHSHAIDFALLKSKLPRVEPMHGVFPCVSDVVGVLATWRTVVTGGHWALIGHADPLVPVHLCPNQRLMAAGNVQVTHASWGLLEKFLSAYHGFFPWNMYPAFDFDSYLLPNHPRPEVARVLNEADLHTIRSAAKERAHVA